MRALCLIALAACGPASPQPSGPAAPAPAPAPSAAGEPEPAMPVDAEPAAKGATKPASVTEQWITAHNAVRAKHCAPPLTWSKKLAEVAQSWANQLKAKGCMFGHSGGTYGENLAAGSIGALDPESTVAMWYDEIKLYKFPDGGFSMKTGHFTQVVWKSTREVGCGHAQCNGNDIYVCNYDPPGNWEGQYRAEVLPTSCKK